MKYIDGEWELRHRGVLHGRVTRMYEDGTHEMSVHLDIRTGELLKKPHKLVKVQGYYEICLEEDGFDMSTKVI
jgi:hypothetical protein